MYFDPLALSSDPMNSVRPPTDPPGAFSQCGSLNVMRKVPPSGETNFAPMANSSVERPSAFALSAFTTSTYWSAAFGSNLILSSYPSANSR